MTEPKLSDWDHQCQWSYGIMRCRYPVWLFLEGARTGLCIFHRKTSTGHAAAQIAQESETATREQYVESAKLLMYGVGDNADVAALRAKLRKGVANPALNVAMPVREPGADESEAA